MSSSLTLFTEASLMLSEANTLQKAKELKDLAITAGEWARRKNAGEEAIQFCRTYAFEAERRMGELLRETERATGTDKGGRQYVDGHNPLPSNSPPTLAELGITKNESAKAQKLAALPMEAFEAVRDGKKRFNEVRREIKLAEVKESAKRY